MIYLFIGEDELAKTEKIRYFKKQLFDSKLEPFNSEVFQAKELSLPLFKEALGRIPQAAKNRLLVIKDILKLKNSLQEYFLSQIESLPSNLIIILDIVKIPPEKNLFINRILKIAKAVYFKSKESANAFDLARALEEKNADYGLNVLADLFKSGEKPERILGALRYQFAKHSLNREEKIKKIGLLLEADINLKSGKLKPEFALELLVVKLCRI